MHIDSLYRNLITYPSPSKFTYVFNNIIKNINSVKISSIELGNTTSFVSSKKNNNFFTIYLPNKLNDPNGTKVQLPDVLLQAIPDFINSFNSILNKLFNSSFTLFGTNNNPVETSEKYFYIFYLNTNLTILFDFNSCDMPPSLQSILTINAGWTSMYGLVLQIQNYVLKQYNARVEYLKSNTAPAINLDSGHFGLVDSSGNYLVPNGSDIYQVDSDGNNLGINLIVDKRNGPILTIPVFDRRFRLDPSGNNIGIVDCVRNDPMLLNNNPYNSNINYDSEILTNPIDILNNNLENLKYDIYTTYVNDVDSYFLNGGTSPGNGILDNLDSGNIYIPPGYLLAGGLLNAKSIYYINNINNFPTSKSIQMYNLQFKTVSLTQQIYITNTFDDINNPLSTNTTKQKYYYYYVDSSGQSWSNGDTLDNINTLENLLDQYYLYLNDFISGEQYSDPNYTVDLSKDIAPFEIDFECIPSVNAVSNNITTLEKLTYMPIGYLLGFKPNPTYFFSSIINNLSTDIKSFNPASLSGSYYVFLKINDWGNYNFFDHTLLGKVLLPESAGSSSYGSYATSNSIINSGYKFRQPVNINRLDIELIDYLGNTLELNGCDWSITLQFTVEYSAIDKAEYEKKNLVFDTRTIDTKKITTSLIKK